MNLQNSLMALTLILAFSFSEETVFKVNGMMCERGCAYKVNSIVNSIDGIKNCQVDFEKGTVLVNYDPKKTNDQIILTKLETETTYKIIKIKKRSFLEWFKNLAS